MTRSDLARITGLARSTVAQRVDALLAHGLVYEAGGTASTGGRPPTLLAFNQRAGVVLVADLGATHSRLAVSDLAGAPLAEVAFDMDIADGPETVLGLVDERFAALLDEVGRTPRGRARHRRRRARPGRVRHGPAGEPADHAGLGRLPDPATGSPSRYDAPVLVDNDVNIMALGEHWAHWRETDHLLFVKVGTGIGCGIVAGRRDPPRRRRAPPATSGTSGWPATTTCVCRCGNIGCLEAVAGGGALARRLTDAGIEAHDSRDVVRLVRAGERRRSGWCARPAARSARCSPAA